MTTTSKGPTRAELLRHNKELGEITDTVRRELSVARDTATAHARDAENARRDHQATLAKMHDVHREADAWKTVAEQYRREITALRFDLAMAGAPQGHGGQSEGVRPIR